MPTAAYDPVTGMPSPIIDLGTGRLSGAYLLHIEVPERLAVHFGRYAQGQAVVVDPGAYLYIGSASSAHGGNPLIPRVARHLVRTPPRPPHGLYARWRAYVAGLGIDLGPAASKRCFWHVDYLLDQEMVQVTHVVIARSATRCEAAIVALVEGLGFAHPVAAGLGAQDHRGHTHLLRWDGDATAWSRLLQALSTLPSTGSTSG